MSKEFWQAKIWGLLHDPLLKSLYKKKNAEGIWVEILHKLGNDNPIELQTKICIADHIAAASDRPSWDQDNKRGHVDYKYDSGLHVSHLLSGQSQSVVIADRTDAHPQQDQSLKSKEADIIRDNLFPLLDGLSEDEQHQKAFWWLWRCLPVAIAEEFGENTALLPADTRIPDCSIWSHNSSVSAIAGSLVGLEESNNQRPYLMIFTMTPIQEMIKASRKMQDFWAGSWLLHYLSAKVCWKWACKYGPDSLVYPSLYAQPLIDHELLKRWSDFGTWIEKPSPKQLLTAGFPNVLVAVLPEHVVRGSKGNALSIAENTLREVWGDLGNRVWKKLPRTEGVNQTRLWDDWLKHQWQTYCTALPLGNTSPYPDTNDLKRGQGEIMTDNTHSSPSKIQQLSPIKYRFLNWVNSQNMFCQIPDIPEQAIDPVTLKWNSSTLQEYTCPTLAELSTYNQFNVGLWWSSIFDQLRHNLAGVKNARTWQLPSAFGPRSTISGIGPVLHPQQYHQGQPIDWVTDSETRKFWQKGRGWFDGREELNATEVLKRGLRKILPDLLGLEPKDLAGAYPDLTVGVAGLLRKLKRQEDEAGISKYRELGQNICDQFSWAKISSEEPWGIPWIDDNRNDYKLPHPRLFHAGWLIEDYPSENEESLQAEQKKLRELIQTKFPAGANPTDWYVLGAGDGDDMGKWLQGVKLKPYKNYVAKNYPDANARKNWEGVEAFLNTKKRMGGATHAALSRALLDFSNQLVPYLTEQRYAGRLIYSGGDDVLAYSNLWEWDSWLWDVRQCFRGAEDTEFSNDGDYWNWRNGEPPQQGLSRPLFTMGRLATISFGTVIANQGVPLAIALENLWEAEAEAKEHFCTALEEGKRKKDAVQVRVLYGNGNVLKATAKFDAFNQWRNLLVAIPDLEPALFEQAAEIWKQHPVPVELAIALWVQAFCARRDALSKEDAESFGNALHTFLKELWETTDETDRDEEVSNWLKLAAFVLRKREIKLGGQS